MIRGLYIIIFVFVSFLSFSQVSIQKTESDYTLKIETDSIIRHLTFWKDKETDVYSGCKYSCSKFKVLAKPLSLKDEIKNIEILWKMAEDSISIALNRVFIGYPEEYSDIFLNQINAFNQSEEWQHHIKKNGKTLNNKIMHEIMMDYNVYEPLNNLLSEKGFRIIDFSTEKHGFATRESLKNHGFTGNEIIPLPFMVWVIIEPK
ncbi:MAG: hypothetical protein AB7S50_01070 [Bacteroidales bacterium]